MIQLCIYIFHILFDYGLSQDIEYSSLCYTVGPYCSSIVYIIADTNYLLTQKSPATPPPPNSLSPWSATSLLTELDHAGDTSEVKSWFRCFCKSRIFSFFRALKICLYFFCLQAEKNQIFSYIACEMENIFSFCF